MSQSITLYCGLELPLVIDQMRSSANLVMWKEVADDAA